MVLLPVDLLDLGIKVIEVPKDARPRCYRCQYLCLADFGYSDYTVEGRLVECLHSGFDQREDSSDGYSDVEKKLRDQYGAMNAGAILCDRFKKGDPLALNVDCDQADIKAARLKGDRDLEKKLRNSGYSNGDS